MTKLSFKELLDLSLFPIKLEGEKAVAQAQATAATVAAQIQTAILEGIVPDEETAQLRRENARMRANNELLEEQLKRAELLKRAEKAGLIETSQEP